MIGVNLRELAGQIESGKFKQSLERHLSLETRTLLDTLTAKETEDRLNRIVREPIQLSGENSRELLQLYYTASWLHLFETLNISPQAKLFEIASGDTDFIPQALDAYAGAEGRYVTANLNKELTQLFKRKTAVLNVDVQIIEDDGARILDYVEGGTFDAVAFHHAINDIVQTIIADAEGIDTVTNNWWDIEPQMLKAVMEYHHSGKLKGAVYEKFIGIVDTCRGLLKQGGYMIFDNCSYDGYEQIGYSTAFHSNYINLARAWIKEADLGLEEVEPEGYDGKWWMILRKV